MSDAEHTSSETLGEMFQRITGETTLTESQDPTDSHLAPTDEEGYEQYHDVLARHEDLSDALSDPDTK